MPRPLKKDSCNTCRQRKVKCDGEYPICQPCKKSSRYCDRSEKAATFRHWTGPSNSSRAISDLHQFEPPEDPRTVLKDQNLARVFHHYVQNVSQWYDLSDSAQHFGLLVPQSALDQPLLFCAIIALSAMQLTQTTTKNLRHTAEYYHGCCIRILIGIQDGNEIISNGVALAATCLLRSYEILDGDIDPNRHLRGAYSMASQAGLLSGTLQPSLLTAGFWNYLREDITFSLFERCPLKIDLEPFPLLSHHDFEQDYLNSISLVLGKIINSAFDHHLSSAEWASSFAMLEEWTLASPARLLPYSVGDGLAGTVSSLPSVWFLQPSHASVMHYLLVCLIILAMQAPPSRIDDIRQLHPFPDGPDSVADDLVESCALFVCGIVFTTRIPAVIVNAFGPMAFSARFIRGEAPRQELKRQLIACKPMIGWPVERLIESLESSWRGP